MANWKIKDPVQIPKSVQESLHPIIAQLLLQRGIDTNEKINQFLFPDYARDILDPFLFSQMKKVMERIKKARESKEKVLIYGDYDADGVTASAILQEALGEIGIDAQVYIPNKKIEGYGMNLKAVDEFKSQNVSLIITVDCGISNYQEVEKANKYGLEVIVIDHHHIPPQIPAAYAIINPNLKDSGYPFEYLAGVGVVFKVIQAIYKTFIPKKEEQLKWLLDLVAIGTVADCVPLKEENRALVKYGLIVLSKTRRQGIQEIFSVGRIQIDENNFPDTKKISFQIAPRINAAGRMDHANVALHLIQEKDQIKARNLALELESNNQERQKATTVIVEEIRILADNMFKDKHFVFAVGEHFPIGIAGLAAGKIAEEFQKPTMVLQKGEKESQGSLRSIPQVNIIEAIEQCADLLIKFGGHSQAAGISIRNENLDKFFEQFGKIIENELKGKDTSAGIEIDAEIKPADIDYHLTDELKKFEPFGEENEEPIFAMRHLIVHEIRSVGNGSKHLKLSLRAQDGSPKIFEAIGFNLSGQFSHLKSGDVIDAAFTLCEDDWNGNKKIQLKLIDIKL